MNAANRGRAKAAFALLCDKKNETIIIDCKRKLCCFCCALLCSKTQVTAWNLRGAKRTTGQPIELTIANLIVGQLNCWTCHFNFDASLSARYFIVFFRNKCDNEKEKEQRLVYLLGQALNSHFGTSVTMEANAFICSYPSIQLAKNLTCIRSVSF